MRVASVFAAALSAALWAAAPASADTPMQPPMNDFNEAFYVCDGANFVVSYDSDTPTAVTLTTSNNNRQYQLKRTTAPSGVQFGDQPVKFWTDGKTVVVQGAGGSFQNCKRKTS